MAIRGGKVVAYCSLACRDGLLPAVVAPPEAPPPPKKSPAQSAARTEQRPRESWRVLASVVIAAGVVLLAVLGGAVGSAARPSTKAADVGVIGTLAASTRSSVKPRPMERAWMIPLSGSDRRIPDVPSRRFGAFRAHPHPRECRQGHCGIDLSAKIGEPVMAVTSGFVEHIANEDPNRLGGYYVRLVHPAAGGAIVTWYMHLSRIRRDLAVGDVVAPGQVIGFAGKSGIEASEPHLHFAVGLRFPDRTVDLFVDPEPLLRKWRLQTGSSGLAVLRKE